MIAPSSKLLWAAAVTVVPLCALAFTTPLPATAGLLILMLLFAWDALAATRLVKTLALALPARANWFQQRPATLDLEITNRTSSERPVRVYLALPGAAPTLSGGLLLTAPPGASAHPIAFTPLERGKFTVMEAELEINSPWGFWHARAVLPVSSEIRIYPDLREDRASLLLARQSNGAQRQRQMGKGREFEKLRDYLPGDSFDDIHWRASARHAKPVVKVTQIERTQQVYAVIDASRLSARYGVLDRFVHAALGMAIAAEAQGDRFGLVVFSDRIDAFVSAGSGKAHFARCRDAIYTLQPRRVSPDFDELFSFLQLRIRTRSLLLCLTALDDPLLAEMFLNSMRTVARRHLLMVSVPKLEGARPLFTGPGPTDTAGLYSGLAGHMQWARLRELAGTLEHSGVKLTSIDPAHATRDVARQYFETRRKQLL